MKIKAIITGATGMVGKGVLYECFDSNDVDEVLVINRQSLGIKHPKLKEIIHHDFFNLDPIKEQLKGYNACYFCLGVSSVGMSETNFHKVTFDLTLHMAKILAEQSPELTFCYVSGTGTDSTEKGRTMWARVKGKTENAIMALPFKASYMFRPGYIQPQRGIKSKTALYNAIYIVFKPLYPILKRLSPSYFTSTTKVGQAMINVTLNGYEKRHLENKDINTAAE